MSGHSKWETTKRQKAVVDAKRGALSRGAEVTVPGHSRTASETRPPFGVYFTALSTRL